MSKHEMTQFTCDVCLDTMDSRTPEAPANWATLHGITLPGSETLCERHVCEDCVREIIKQHGETA